MVIFTFVFHIALLSCDGYFIFTFVFHIALLSCDGYCLSCWSV